jgi:hypothetical protein
VEFLAATDKDQITPTGKIIGRPSFSKVLSDQLEEMLEKDGVVTITGLQKRMVQADLGLVRQPFYIPLSEDSAGQIRLSRWEDLTSILRIPSSVVASSNTDRAASLMLRLSLFAPLDATARRTLSTWLTRNSPPAIEDIEDIEHAITQAELIGINDRSTTAVENSASQSGVLHLFSGQAQTEGTRLFDALKEAMFVPTTCSTEELDATDVIEDIRQKSTELVTFLADCLTSLRVKDLESLMDKSLHSNADLAGRISMRLRVLQEDVSQDTSKVQFPGHAAPEQTLRIGTQTGVPVLVEYHAYELESEQELTRVSKQVARIAVLLGEPKIEAFRVLPGKGYLQETLYGRRFGLIHKLLHDVGADGVIRLSQLIAKAKAYPLASRCRLANCLCDAILHLHSIGWFHKSIKPDNIIFLRKKQFQSEGGMLYEEYDIENPYLVGFDCSRPSEGETWTDVEWNAENNVYRHPDRWGNVNVRFERHHDFFDLVCCPS